MRYLILLVLFLALVGCDKAVKEPAVVTINTYSITPVEFEREFQDSALRKKDSPEARKQFLEMVINRKLILQEAQRLGLDRDPEFLGAVERFWEQSLLKSYLDRKTKEISGRVFVSDFAVEQAYKGLAAEGKADKPYEEMYRTLKWQLIRAREAELMDEWLKGLRAKAKIRENPELLRGK